MKTTIFNALIVASILLAGCGKNSDSSTSPSVPTAAPVAQPVLTAWQQEKSAAVSRFLETDWSARPLFASGSALGLSENQFKALSVTEQQARSAEVMPQLDAFKQLAAAVAQAGREAAAKGDTAQARKCFTALQQCGTAFASPENLRIVQLVGQAMKKMADAELTKQP